jgi:hypothetical protein
MGHCIFQMVSFFQPHYGPGVDSATNKSKYQESSGSWRATGAWGLQSHRHIWTDWPGNVGASTSHNLMGLHVLLQGSFIFIGWHPYPTNYDNSMIGGRLVLSCSCVCPERATERICRFYWASCHCNPCTPCFVISCHPQIPMWRPCKIMWLEQQQCTVLHGPEILEFIFIKICVLF